MQDDINMLKDQLTDLQAKIKQLEGQATTANEVRDMHIRASGLMGVEIEEATDLIAAALSALRGADNLIREKIASKNAYRTETLMRLEAFLAKNDEQLDEQLIGAMIIVHCPETDEVSDPVPVGVTSHLHMGGDKEYRFTEAVRIQLPPTWKGTKSKLILVDGTGKQRAVMDCYGDTGPGVLVELRPLEL